MKEKTSINIMRTRDLAYYWKNSYKIDGGFDLKATRIIAMLDDSQKTSGITGNIFEIGVHHGK
jgi:hypothetical protein